MSLFLIDSEIVLGKRDGSVSLMGRAYRDVGSAENAGSNFRPRNPCSLCSRSRQTAPALLYHSHPCESRRLRAPVGNTVTLAGSLVVKSGVLSFLKNLFRSQRLKVSECFAGMLLGRLG